MFDIFEMMNVGREITAHGEKWILLKQLFNGAYLVAKQGDSFPCQVFCVKVDEPIEKERTRNDKPNTLED